MSSLPGMEPLDRSTGTESFEERLFAIRIPEWQHKAACLGKGVDIFFVERGEADKAAQAKAVCETCEVKQECLNYAIDNHINEGIWGGLARNERRQYLKVREYRKNWSCPEMCKQDAERGSQSSMTTHLKKGIPPCDYARQGVVAYKRRKSDIAKRYRDKKRKEMQSHARLATNDTL